MEQYTSSSTHTRRSMFRYMFTGDTGRKVWITIALVFIYRLLLNIPLPGFVAISGASKASVNSAFTLVEFIDMLSGGGLLKTSILGLGLLPFTMAGQIMQYLVPIIPSLRRSVEEYPPGGRRLVERWQYFLAIPIALLEAWMFLHLTLMDCNGVKFLDLGANLDTLSKIAIAVIMTGGSFFAVWMGSLISEFGIRGQGLSILIFSGIAGSLPGRIIELSAKPDIVKDLVVYVAIFVASIIIVIYLQQGRRNVPVMYPGRRVGNRMAMPVKGMLPLMINMGGVEGFVGSQIIVALATFYAPLAVCSSTQWLKNLALGTISIFSETGPWFGPVAFLSVFLYTNFYTDVLFQQQNYGDTLRRSGAAIPGVDRIMGTQKYLTKINRRITVVGSLIMGFLAILPWLSNLIAGTSLPLLDGEKTIIMVAVIRDILANLEADIRLRGYQDSLLIK